MYTTYSSLKSNFSNVLDSHPPAKASKANWRSSVTHAMSGRIEIDDVTVNVEETVLTLVELRDDLRDAERDVAEGRRELAAGKREFASWKTYARRRLRGLRRAWKLLSASGTDADVASLLLALDGHPDPESESESKPGTVANSPTERIGASDSSD